LWVIPVPFIVVGRVVPGERKAAGFLGLEWVQRQIREKVGFKPYMGTLNLHIEGPTVGEHKRYVDNHGGIRIEPIDGHYRPGVLHRVRINETLEGAVVIPQVQGYPADKIEVIAPVDLRETLSLRDGDEVTITYQE
jgi:riboflavin kinase